MLLFGFQKAETQTYSRIHLLNYVQRTLIHAFLPLNTSRIHWFLHLSLKKLQPYCVSSFLTTPDLICGLFRAFQMLHNSSIPCLFVYIIGEGHCYLSLSFLTSSKIRASLFVVCLLLNKLFGLFCAILICKYVSRMYLVAV